MPEEAVLKKAKSMFLESRFSLPGNKR